MTISCDPIVFFYCSHNEAENNGVQDDGLECFLEGEEKSLQAQNFATHRKSPIFIQSS